MHENVQQKIKFFAGDGLVGLLDFLKKKPTPSVEITVHEAPREELEAQIK